eukprot:gene14519-17139_t
MSFVMNLDTHDKPGSHWVSCYIDADGDKTVEYYDSFGEDPTDDFMKSIKGVINKINPDTYLKFKVNKNTEKSEANFRLLKTPTFDGFGRPLTHCQSSKVSVIVSQDIHEAAYEIVMYQIGHLFTLRGWQMPFEGYYSLSPIVSVL